MIFVLIGFSACKKNAVSPSVVPPGKNYTDFLKNTEWVGVDDGKTSQYPRPADLKFHADSTITIYSIFYLSSDGGTTIRSADSINGKMTKIDSLADGRTRISANFPDLGGDQLISITDRKTFTMSAADPNQPSINSRIYNLQLFPADGISLSGTSWSGQPVNPGDPSNTYYYYPDLSIIAFNTIDGNDIVAYTKDGHIIEQQTGQELGVLQISYQQIGARVFLFGYDDDYSWDMDIALKTGNYTDYRQGRLIGYMGILLPSGDRMFIDSWSANARLPNYAQTTDHYGPAGVTPVIRRL